MAVGAAAVYLPLGVCWSLFRWNWIVGNAITELLKSRKSYGDDKERWAEYVDDYTPKASSNKERICFWIAYWPLSIAWFVVSDFITELVEKIYARIAKWFDAISERQKRRAKGK
jgi:hypothetical protein